MKPLSLIWSLMIAAGLIVAQPSIGLSQTAKESADPARQLFNKGVEFQSHGDYAQAEKTFREVLRRYPTDKHSDQTAFYLIDTLMRLRRVQEARTEAENFPRRYPQSKWKTDVAEVILELGGPAPADARIWNSPAELREAQARANRMLGLSTPIGGPSNSIYPDNFPPNASMYAEILRQMIQLDRERGIEEAKQRLRENPSDPVVVANLGTIANSDSSQAIPFLLSVWGNTAATPNARNTAFFWFARRNPDKQEVARAITDLFQRPQTEGVASEALRNMTVADHRAVLEKIVMASNPEKFVLIEKIYRRGSELLRPDLLMFVARLDDSRAVPFIVKAAQSDPDPDVRAAAARALGTRKDVDASTLQTLIRSVPPPPRPTQPSRFMAPASGSAISGLTP